MNTSNQAHHELLDYLLAADDRQSMAYRLEQLLTPSEYEEIIKRLQIFKLLKAGVAQRKIAEQLGVGIATVSRGARALKNS